VLDGPGIGDAAVGGRHRRSRRVAIRDVCCCAARVVSAAADRSAPRPSQCPRKVHSNTTFKRRHRGAGGDAGGSGKRAHGADGAGSGRPSRTCVSWPETVRARARVPCAERGPRPRARSKRCVSLLEALCKAPKICHPQNNDFTESRSSSSRALFGRFLLDDLLIIPYNPAPHALYDPNNFCNYRQ
jgi:hypothetical protein